MLCDVCKKKKANVFIKKSMEGEVREHRLCDDCAGSAGHGLDLYGLSYDVFPSISDMLAGFSDIGKIGDSEGQSCPVCGTTFSDFQHRGRLGCGSCYETFSEKLTTLMMRLQGSVQHAGKVPSGIENEIQQRKLGMELKEAVSKEEYERAAVIRDRIRELNEKEDEV